MSIDNLPVEILVFIFRALRDMHIHTRSSRWLFVTHVCQYWRSTALDDAELWTQIYSPYTDCVQAFLIRSKMEPLDVYYPLEDGKTMRSGNIVSLLLPESSRFRHVELGRLIAAHSFLTYPFPGGAPLLSHLDLDYLFLTPTHPPPGPALQSLTKLPDAMPEICEHGLPVLRRLRLKHWPVANFASLRGLVNPSLRSLVIIRPHIRHPASTWAHLLTELPLLEHLTLAGAFPVVTGDADSAIQGSMPSIHLPHLSSLRLREDDSIPQLSLLQHTIVSPGVHITFSTRNDRGIRIPYERYTGILRTISEKLTRGQHMDSNCPTSLKITLTDTGTRAANIMHTVIVTLWTDTDDTDEPYCSRFPPERSIVPISMLSITGVLALRHSVCPPLRDMLRTTFSWSALRKLSLFSDRMSYFVQDTQGLLIFKDLLLQMINLRVLAIDSNYPTESLLILLGPVDTPLYPRVDEGTGSAARVLFPLLEILVIKAWHNTDTDYEPFCRPLLSRKEAGYPITKVHICLPGQRTLGSPDFVDPLWKPQAAVVSLAPLGCSIDFCFGEDGDWHIQELTSTE